MSCLNDVPKSAQMVLSLEVLEPRILLNGTPTPALDLFDALSPLFIENQGQWADASVRYGFQDHGLSVSMTDAGPLFRLRDGSGADAQSADFAATFVGAAAVTPVGVDPSGAAFNYYVGDQSTWRTGVSGYAGVEYAGLYDGIDLQVNGQPGGLKYEFDVAPGADYGQIQVSYSGVDGLSMADDGSLHVQTAAGELVDQAPDIYQVIEGQKVGVAGQFVLVNSTTYSFQVTGQYDATQELIIDPSVAWSTYLGGSYDDVAYGVAVDSNDNADVAGYATSDDLPGNTNDPIGGGDAFVAQVDSAGELQWLTYVGGGAYDEADAIAVDSADNALITGLTQSTDDFAMITNTYEGGAQDAFVAQLSSSGTLNWATYVGGSLDDEGDGIAVDSNDNALIAGMIDSTDLDGATNSFQGDHRDAFVAQVDSSGDVQWATYLGGTGDEWGSGVAVDSNDNALVSGWTDSTDLQNKTNDYLGGLDDAFAAKLSSAGAVQWSTYLGGSGDDYGQGVAVDSNDNLLVSGQTPSDDMVGANNDYQGGFEDIFVAKLTNAGALTWSTYLGGTNGDFGQGIAVNSQDGAVVTGWTYSSDFTGSVGTYDGFQDAFAAQVSSGGSQQWAIFLGGAQGQQAYGAAVDSSDNAFVAGLTTSSDLVGHNNDYSLNQDGFLAKITQPAATADLTVSDVSGPAQMAVDGQDTVDATVHNTGTADSGAFNLGIYLSADQTWDSGDTLVASRTISNQAADSSTGYQVSVDLSGVGGLSTGTYYWIAYADTTGLVPESNEDNNWAAATLPVTLEPPQQVDLTVSGVSGPTQIGTEGQGTVSLTLNNTGADPSGASELGVYLSTDQTWDAGDTLVTTMNDASLAGGASQPYQVPIDLSTVGGLSGGTYYWIAYADVGDQVTETNEANNTAASATPVSVEEGFIGVFTQGNTTVSIYDVSGPVDVSLADISVKFGKDGSVSSIGLGGTQAMGGLGIIIHGATSVGTIKDGRKGAVGDIAFITSQSAIKGLALNSGMTGYDLNGKTMGGVTFAPDIDGDGDTADATALFTDGAVGKVSFVGNMAGDVFINGADPKKRLSFSSFGSKTGGLTGDLKASGNGGKFALGGSFDSTMTIDGSLAGFTLTGGVFSGVLNIFGDAGKLSAASPKGGGTLTVDANVSIYGALSSLALKGADFGGKLTVYSDAGKVQMSGGKGGGGTFLAGAEMDVYGLLSGAKIGAVETDNGGDAFGIYAVQFGKIAIGKTKIGPGDIPYVDGDFQVGPLV